MRKIASLIVMLILFQVLAFSQNRTVTGIIKDEAGLIVPGASVRIKGTKVGVAADNQGQFRIQTKAGDVLLVTGAGIDPAEITVGSSDAVSITVKNTIATGSEVIVTALGIKRQDKALGYSVSKVDPNNLLQKSEPDILKGLQGKVPGVDIRSTQGVPGASTRIQIRGNSSFGLETQPLIVVDGVPYSNTQLVTSSQTSAGGAYGNGFADLDPNDIETFNILKGAAAAALYGSRASRGVIVITTKSGSGKKGAKPLNVTFKTSYSFEDISNLPEFQNAYGTGAQNRPGGGSNGSWGGKFGAGQVYDGSGNIVRASSSGVDSIPAWAPYLAAYPELFDANGRTGYKAYPNNVKDLFNTGTVFENSISVNGGNDNNTFSVTGSNVNHKGYVENSSYTRTNFSVGGQTKYRDLTLGGNVAYTRSKQIGGFFGAGQSFTTQFGRTLIGGRSWSIPDFPSEDRAGKPLAFIAGQYTNPIWGAYHNTITTVDERVVANFRAAYKVNNWFNVNFTAGANNAGTFRDQIIDEFSPGVGNGLGRIVEDQFRQLELQTTLLGVFTPKIGKDFSLDIKLGSDFNQRTSRRQANQGDDLIVPKIFSITNTVTKLFLADDRTKRRLFGVFTEATVGYKNFAFLTATERMDRTSTLPYENARYFYPSISGSLIWTDAFKLRSNWLDYGKIRAGYAKVGNDANPHNGEDLYSLATSSFLNQPYATRGGQTVDPGLTPEFTKELELGTDLTLFKRRVNLEFTWYDKRSTDLIYAISVPITTGYSSFFTNIGEISNKGIEAGLTVRPIMKRDFTWEVRGVFTKNDNIVEELVPGLIRSQLGNIAYIEAGMPYGYLRGNKAARAPDGQLLIDNASGWPIIALDQGMIGDPTPDYKLGITNTLNFKGFSLGVLWDMTKGGAFSSETVSSLLGRGVTRDTEDRETNRVVKGVYADPNNIYVPYMPAGKPIPNQTRISTNDLYFSTSSIAASFAINGISEFQVFDGTVYRLREVTLGYDLPLEAVRKLKLTAINFSISGRNLWYLAPNVPKYTHFDPETNSLGSGAIQGVEISAAPTTRRIGFNLNITF
jgi:TonB-linked SusC/RagA family outer membrane protein